jgi:hypothetical protein
MIEPLVPPQPKPHPSSYRDPSGYIFTYKNEIYRQINLSFQNDFEAFIQSGLYECLFFTWLYKVSIA